VGFRRRHHSHYCAAMWNPFRRHDNAWIETDRQEFRRIVITGVILVAAVLAGAGFLIYSLVEK